MISRNEETTERQEIACQWHSYLILVRVSVHAESNERSNGWSEEMLDLSSVRMAGLRGERWGGGRSKDF